jgi:hypothetical protein
MGAGGAAARSAFDEEAGDRFTRVGLGSARWKLEDLARIERVRNAQRLIERHALRGRQLLLSKCTRRRCARRIRRSDLAVQSVARCYRSERQRKRNRYIT